MADVPSPEQDRFDEAGYFRLYPDLARAIAAGAEFSGWLHYQKHGRGEGRRPNDVDAAFYLQTYPQAVADIAAGRAGDAATHYIRFGRARGYRPNPAVPAVAATEPPAAVPWLWTDLPHAPDLIAGRLALGRLSERQAALLQGWVRDGFIALKDPFDPRALAAAALDLERCFAGACPDLLFSCGAVALGPVHWQPEINPYPAAALDIHYVSHAVRSLLFAAPVAEVLGLLFDTPALLAHSRGVLRGGAQTAQRDGATARFSLPGRFVSASVMLEDRGAGAVRCYPGSHRVPRPGGGPLADRMADHGLVAQELDVRRGQVVIRHPALLHEADPVPDAQTRREIVAQFCPHYVAPSYADRVPTQIWPHDAHGFTTQYYTALEPLD